MSLLSKLERLEKAASKAKSEPQRDDPELEAMFSRVLAESAERAERRDKLPLHELVAELRVELAERVKENEHRCAHPEQYQQELDMYGGNWNWLSERVEQDTRKNLARLEAEVAKLP